MRHPTEGSLRRLLDEPSGVGLDDREHVLSCEACQRSLAIMRDDADAVAAALGPASVPATDVDAAWARVSAAASADRGGELVSLPINRSRLRDAIRRPAVAGLAVAVVLAGAGTAAANDWLPIFQAERVVPVAISAADLNALPDLRAYGDVEFSGSPNVRRVANAEAAESETDIELPEVTHLPRGVTGDPTYQVGREVTLTFTFSADRAARTAAESGSELPTPPPGLDGSRMRLAAGPGVAMLWRRAEGIPTLVIGRAVAPSAFSSSGLPYETIRNYLLSLPGLPEDVARSLRTFDTDPATLPLPVPAGLVASSTSEVGGAPATVLTSQDGSITALIWVEDGMVNVVAGSVDTDEVLAVARGLR